MPVVYFPFAQNSGGAFSIVVRTGNDPAAQTAAVRAAAASIDPGLPLFQLRTMDQIVGQSEAVFMRRQVLSLLSVFGVSALVVSTLGLYGVLAQLVVQRRREIGVRVALGARGPRRRAAGVASRPDARRYGHRRGHRRQPGGGQIRPEPALRGLAIRSAFADGGRCPAARFDPCRLPRSSLACVARGSCHCTQRGITPTYLITGCPRGAPALSRAAVRLPTQRRPCPSEADFRKPENGLR